MTDSSHAVLLVDDEPLFLVSAALVLRSAGISPVMTLEDSRLVLPFLAEKEAALVILDLSMPHVSGTDLLGRIREEHPEVPAIVLTARNEVDTAVACMKAGAIDYLVKPIESSRFVASVRRALETTTLRSQVSALRERLLSGRLENEDAFSGIVTNSPMMRAVFQYVEAVARSREPVLVIGETGSGKELIASAVHELSGRKGEFVPVDVAGLDDVMFSDTLFGHRKGAYTGAEEPREGLIARASGGTLFLDEIGDLKESSQVKLLRLLEERKYYPLGSDVPRECDARIVCATHRDVKTLSASGAFRKDLYYRLAAHQVRLPPLRERPEDLPLLVAHFLEQSAASLRKKKPTPPPEIFTLLSTYSFPGNVRELKMMVFDAVARHGGGVLSLESFRGAIRTDHAHAAVSRSPGEGAQNPFPLTARFPSLKEAEEYLVAEALRRAGNNQGIAASLLGITRQALNKRLVRNGKRPGGGR